MVLENKAPALIGAMVIVTLFLVPAGHGAKYPNARNAIDPPDSIATRAYLDGEYGALPSIKDGAAAAARAITVVVTGATDKCPRVASGVSYGSQKNQGEEWASDVIDLAIVRSEIGIDSRFRNSVIHLHWTDPRIAALVAANLRKLQRETEVRMPPLCRDLRIWADGGFRRA
jgi:hypothetical protein